MSYMKVCCIVAALMCATVRGVFVEEVARVHAEGVTVYIPVDKRVLQHKLDFFEGVSGGPKLFLPANLDHFDDLPEGTHPILLDIAFVTLSDFVESEASSPNPNPSLAEALEIFVSIPFLSESVGGPNRYKLGLMVVTDRPMQEAPQTEFIHSYISALEMTLDADGELYVNYGDGEIRIGIDLQNDCKDSEPWSEAPEGAAPEDSEAEGGLDLSMLGRTSDVRFCDHYDHPNRFCENFGRIEEGLSDNVPNVCLAWRSVDEEFCESSVRIDEFSGLIADFVGYAEGTQPIFVEQYGGNFAVGAKFPCV